MPVDQLSRTAFGRFSEGLAADYLARHGYAIIDRNWRRPEGEIDLIVELDGILVFVEVRSRVGVDHGHPLETISATKRARILKSARLYIGLEYPKADGFRFDVVAISFSNGEELQNPEIIHIVDAIQTNL